MGKGDGRRDNVMGRGDGRSSHSVGPDMDDSIMRGTAANGNAVEAKGGGGDAAAKLAKKFRCANAVLLLAAAVWIVERSLSLSRQRAGRSTIYLAHCFPSNFASDGISIYPCIYLSDLPQWLHDLLGYVIENGLII